MYIIHKDVKKEKKRKKEKKKKKERKLGWNKQV